MGDSFLVTRARGAAGCWKGYGPLATRGGGRWRRAQQSFIYMGRLRPRVHPPTLLYNTFDSKGTSFVYLLWTNGTPLISPT